MKYLLYLLLPVALISCKKTSDEHEPVEGLQEISSLEQLNTELSDGVSMIFFHASWCHICQDQRPAVTSVAEDSELNEVYFGEVEFDDYPDITEEYNVAGFPTIVIFKDGDEVDRYTGGGHSTAELKSAIQAHF
jgi:thiol-disulfide isomerase/thioredoxin